MDSFLTPVACTVSEGKQPSVGKGSLLALGDYGSGSDEEDDLSSSTDNQIRPAVLVPAAACSSAGATSSGSLAMVVTSAQVALPPLRAGWREQVDANTGGTYFWNTETSM